MANESNEAILLQTGNGKLGLTKGGEPNPGNQIMLLQTGNGKITHGTSPPPEIGDEGVLIPTSNGKVYIAPGELCNPSNVGYWKWYPAGIDARPFQGKHLSRLDIMWASPEFKGFKIDVMIQGRVSLWAFGVKVLYMDTPLDGEGYAVPYHLVDEFYSTTPCTANACRLILESVIGRPYATIEGTAEMSVGRKGSVSEGYEVTEI